jgi:hypothetical protein
MIASYTLLHEKMSTEIAFTTNTEGVTSKVKHYSNDVEIFSRNHEDVDMHQHITVGQCSFLLGVHGPHLAVMYHLLESQQPI